MYILNSISDNLTIRLNSVPTTELPVIVSYTDKLINPVEAKHTTDTSGTTSVVICPGPFQNGVREVNSINIYNADVTGQSVTVSYNTVNGTFIILLYTLAAGYHLFYEDDGWHVKDNLGNSVVTTSDLVIGGSDTQFQYNNGGSLGGATMTYNNATEEVSINNLSGSGQKIVEVTNTGKLIIGSKSIADLEAEIGASVQSVTGLDTDNTDPQNPIVQIAVDGVTITGDGTSGNPLVATAITPTLTESEVAYGDASNQVTSDSGFTRDPATFDTAIIFPSAVGDLSVKAGSSEGSDMVSLKQDDATNPIIVGLGDLTGIGGSADQIRLSVRNTTGLGKFAIISMDVTTFLQQLANSITGEYASLTFTNSNSRLEYSDGINVFTFGLDATSAYWQYNLVMFRLPNADGSSGDVLTTDGAGGLSFQPAAGTANTIYTADDSLVSNRTVTLNGKTLSFSDLMPLLSLDPVGFVSFLSAYDGTGISSLVLSAATPSGVNFELTTTDGVITNPVGVYGDGVAATLELSADNGIFAQNELFVGVASTTNGKITWYNATNSNTISFLTGVTGSNLVFTLPTTDSTGTQALVSNGSGVLSWASIPAAATTLYSGDGTLAANRTVTLNSKFLKIANAFGNLLEIDPVGLYTGIQAYNGSRVSTLDLYSAASGDTITKFRLYSYKTTDVEITGDAGLQTIVFVATNGFTFRNAPVTIGEAGTITGSIKLVGTTSGTVTLSVADAAGTWTMKLPTGAGSAGQVLQTDGSGNTSWVTPAASGITRSVNSISSPTTAGSTALTDYVYLVSGTTTLTMPTAVGNTNRYTIKRVGTNTVTIATTGGQTIDGSASASILVQYVSIDLISDGSNWNVI